MGPASPTLDNPHGRAQSFGRRIKQFLEKLHGRPFPKGDVVTLEFPGNAKRGPITMHWHSGVERVPRPAEFEADDKDIGAGAVVIGDKGKRAGTKLEWDAEKVQFAHNGAANALLNPPARTG